jgi:putative zinc finger protein
VKHDPELAASAYLAGDMTRRRRRAFENHMLDCHECWAEVAAGRSGRAVAEGARELAPQPLRELVRASVAALDPPPPKRRMSLGLGVALAAIVGIAVTGGLLWNARSQQPPGIAALIRDFRTESGGPSSELLLPRQLGDLRIRSTRSVSVGGVEMTAHEYVDPAGHRVVVYRADGRFPVAEGAEHSPDGATWTASADGVVLFCADQPAPSLLIGDDGREVKLAASELGIR